MYIVFTHTHIYIYLCVHYSCIYMGLFALMNLFHSLLSYFIYHGIRCRQISPESCSVLSMTLVSFVPFLLVKTLQVLRHDLIALERALLAFHRALSAFQQALHALTCLSTSLASFVHPAALCLPAATIPPLNQREPSEHQSNNHCPTISLSTRPGTSDELQLPTIPDSFLISQPSQQPYSSILFVFFLISSL